jgi:hypothetical protein
MIFGVRVNIVPVGAKLPIAVQEQLFREEESLCLNKEGKCISSLSHSILSHTTCIITNIYI